MAYQDAALRFTLPDDQRAAAANGFARSGVLRVPNVFASDVADALYQHFDSELEWSRTISQAETAFDLSPQAIAAMDSATDQELLTRIHKTATDGFQFLFDSVIVSDVAAERKARGLLLDRVVEALNHPDSLDTFRAITGVPEIRVADGQATRYLPGHFLTSHDDGIDGEGRVAAYVISLTKDWRPDWGGLLQFHSASGDVPLSLKPCFNAISMFRVPQEHSVSYVAPFAAAPRYSITGWVRR